MSESGGVTTISFQELIPGSDGVRITEDGLLWAVDLVMVVTGKNRDDSGWVLRNLKSENFDPSKMIHINLKANGGLKTKLVTFAHALELVMVLPGPLAKKFRVAICDILKRYFEGDESLFDEIQYNKAMGPLEACKDFMSQSSDLGKRMREDDDEVSYVYCTESAAYPGLVKIGHTKNLAARLSSGNTFCAPAPHGLVAVAASFHPARDEKMAHAFFHEQRAEGEFFRTNPVDVIKFFGRYITPAFKEEFSEKPIY
jgi:Meiotically up-regulated gene 113